MKIDKRKTEQKEKTVIKEWFKFYPAKKSTGGDSDYVFVFTEEPINKEEFKYHYVATRDTTRSTRARAIQLVMRFNNKIVVNRWFETWNEMYEFAFNKHLKFRHEDFTSSV